MVRVGEALGHRLLRVGPGAVGLEGSRILLRDGVARPGVVVTPDGRVMTGAGADAVEVAAHLVEPYLLAIEGRGLGSVNRRVLLGVLADRARQGG